MLGSLLQDLITKVLGNYVEKIKDSDMEINVFYVFTFIRLWVVA